MRNAESRFLAEYHEKSVCDTLVTKDDRRLIAYWINVRVELHIKMRR